MNNKNQKQAIKRTKKVTNRNKPRRLKQHDRRKILEINTRVE